MEHSLTSPSNYERRLLCRGSLNAEKDLPNKDSIHSTTGTLLHERITMYLENKEGWDKDLSGDQITAIVDAGTYVNNIKRGENILYEQHEKTYSLSFLEDGMKGTADTVLITHLNEYINTTPIVYLHVIDYKFGKYVQVEAENNKQLYLYYLAVKNDLIIKGYLKNKIVRVELHIVQPYRNTNYYSFILDDKKDKEEIKNIHQVLHECRNKDVRRTPYKEACMFCKAKSTCPEYQDVPNKRLLISKKEEIENVKIKQISINAFKKLENLK